MIQIAAKPHSSASIHLDALRGAAALLVFWSHVRALFFVPYKDVLRPNVLTKALYFLDGFGYSSVTVFFVLSGFLISSSVFRALEKGQWSWGWYAQNRLTRLYVVLIPALLLCAFWDQLGVRLFGLDGVYGGNRHFSCIQPGSILHFSSLGIWLGNLFFLQNIIVPTFGSDIPLWSLSCEFWYYLLFPLCLFILSRRLPGRVRLACALAVTVAAAICRSTLLSYPVWLMGTALCLLPTARPDARRWLCPLASLVFVGVLLAQRSGRMPLGLGGNYLLAAAFTFFLYGVLGSQGRVPALYERAARFWSGVSYTLYLTHVPFLFFVTAFVIGPKTLWQPTAPHLGLGLVVVVVTLAYVSLVWRVAEANTDQVRRYITNKLSRPVEAAAAARRAPALPGLTGKGPAHAAVGGPAEERDRPREHNPL